MCHFNWFHLTVWSESMFALFCVSLNSFSLLISVNIYSSSSSFLLCHFVFKVKSIFDICDTYGLYSSFLSSNCQCFHQMLVGYFLFVLILDQKLIECTRETHIYDMRIVVNIVPFKSWMHQMKKLTSKITCLYIFNIFFLYSQWLILWSTIPSTTCMLVLVLRFFYAIMLLVDVSISMRAYYYDGYSKTSIGVFFSALPMIPLRLLFYHLFSLVAVVELSVCD